MNIVRVAPENVEASDKHLRVFVEDAGSEVTMRGLAVIALFLLEEWRREV